MKNSLNFMSTCLKVVDTRSRQLEDYHPGTKPESRLFVSNVLNQYYARRLD